MVPHTVIHKMPYLSMTHSRIIREHPRGDDGLVDEVVNDVAAVEDEGRAGGGEVGGSEF